MKEANILKAVKSILILALQNFHFFQRFLCNPIFILFLDFSTRFQEVNETRSRIHSYIFYGLYGLLVMWLGDS